MQAMVTVSKTVSIYRILHPCLHNEGDLPEVAETNVAVGERVKTLRPG